MTQSAYRQIMKHLEAETTREHGGLLLGFLAKSNNATPPTIWIAASLPAEHTRGNPTSLTFTEDTWLKFQQDTDDLESLGLKLQRLGWYHSHPGIEIFLSRWDLDVCSNFDQPHHAALVVDPIRNRGGFFIRGERGYRPHEPKGFWEFPDLKAESVIQWENTHEISSDWLIPANELLQVDIVEEPDEIDIPPQDEKPQPEPAPSEATADLAEPEREASKDPAVEATLDGPKSAEPVKAAAPLLGESRSTVQLRPALAGIGKQLRKAWRIFIGQQKFGKSQKRDTRRTRTEETAAHGSDRPDQVIDKRPELGGPVKAEGDERATSNSGQSGNDDSNREPN